RKHLPSAHANATIAFANSNLAYPLQGERFEHRVVVISPRRDVPDFFHLPDTHRRISGEQMISTMAELMNADPDRAAWMERLRAAEVRYLFIAKGSYDHGGAGMADNPVELSLAQNDGNH